VIFLRHDLGEPLPFPDEFFDVVLASEVLEHLANLEAALSEIRRTLKPGGRLVGSVPGAAWSVLADAIRSLHPLYRSFKARLGGRFGARSRTLPLIDPLSPKGVAHKSVPHPQAQMEVWRELLEGHEFVILRAVGSHFFPLLPSSRDPSREDFEPRKSSMTMF
jgi:SAM-dependent methyltransferase